MLLFLFLTKHGIRREILAAPTALTHAVSTGFDDAEAVEKQGSEFNQDLARLSDQVAEMTVPHATVRAEARANKTATGSLSKRHDPSCAQPWATPSGGSAP